jgi:hypothetical protein
MVLGIMGGDLIEMSKFKEDDIVISKNTAGAVRIPGRVFAVWDGEAYLTKMNQFRIDMRPWEEKYPGWTSKNVYAVFFEIPLKSCTPEEWEAQAVRKGQTPEAARKTYGPSCPEVQSMVFPEDDIILAENKDQCSD